MGVGVVGLDLCVGAVPQQALDHRRDLRRRARLELAVDADPAALDMPVDHHAIAAVTGVELRHQVRLPRAEPLGVTGGGGGLAPPLRVPGLEGRVDHPPDRPPQVLPGDVAGADPAQRALVFVVLAGGGHLPDTHIRAQREQREQQPPAQHSAGQYLAGGHRHELVGEAGEELGVFEDVQQINRAPAALHLSLERGEILRLGQLVQFWHAGPRLSVAGHHPHPARSALRHRRVQPVQRFPVPAAQIGDESRGVQRFADRGIVHVAVVAEIARQILVRVTPPPGSLHPHLAAAQGLSQGDQHAQLIGDALDSAIR
ncbi:MAG: hypothetical protein JO287_03265 [Pseudonocardiales bacterium]|nr:hypothetical protein [Pseudonocardiales bacterium]